MKRFSTALLLITGLAAGGLFAASDLTDGVIRKVDKDGGRLIIKHDDIKNLGMPGMTMMFQVKRKSMLDRFNAGDRIKFKVVSEDGRMVVTDIQAAK